MKKRIYLVECKQIRRKKIAVIADDEEDAGNIVDDMLAWGEIDFNTNSSYKEDFNIRSNEEEIKGPYRVLTDEEKEAAYRVAHRE